MAKKIWNSTVVDRGNETNRDRYNKEFESYQRDFDEYKRLGGEDIDQYDVGEMFTDENRHTSWGVETKKIEDKHKLLTGRLDELRNVGSIARNEAERLAGMSSSQESENRALAARNTGLSKSRASALSSNTSYTNQYADSLQGMKNQQVQTQADWLEKMGYANGLQQTASNMKTGAGMQIANAALGGMGAGAQLFVNAFTGRPPSDENVKEPIEPNRDGKLPKSTLEDAINALETQLNARPEEDDNVLNDLAQLETVAYQYKNPECPGQDNEIHPAGFTAQSMEQIPLFKDCVVEVDGVKHIDVDLLENILINKIMPVIRKYYE